MNYCVCTCVWRKWVQEEARAWETVPAQHRVPSREEKRRVILDSRPSLACTLWLISNL